jgi:uncharacterized protein
MSAAGTPTEQDGDAGSSAERRVYNPFTWLMVGLVRVYQLVVSPWLPPSCKYYPSCSAYAVTALRRHGVLKGSALAGWRLLRCNPWSLGGVDHVPARGQWRGAGRPAGRPAHGVGEDGKPRTLGADTWGARTSAPKDR